ncbi:MAG: FAD-dependent oxidoreductase [Candidatus Sericytochromatia bacterium]|nr:FAD-dependent oxidoreductase [Candidatus Sericytochromatia bacterium]
MRAQLPLVTLALVLAAVLAAQSAPAASPDPGRSRLGPFAPRQLRPAAAPARQDLGAPSRRRLDATPRPGLAPAAVASPRRPALAPASTPSGMAASPPPASAITRSRLAASPSPAGAVTRSRSTAIPPSAGASAPASPAPALARPAPSEAPPPAARPPRSHRTAVLPAPAVPLAHAPVDVLVVGEGLNALLVTRYLSEAGVAWHRLAPGPGLAGALRPVRYPHGVSAPDPLARLSPDSALLDLASALKLSSGPLEPSLGAVLAGGVTHAAAGRAPHALLAAVLPADERSAFDAWEARMAALHHVAVAGPVPADVLRLRGLSFEAWLQRTSGLSARARGRMEVASRTDFPVGWRHVSALEGLLAWHRFTTRPAEVRGVQGGGRALAEALAERAGRERLEVGRLLTHLRRLPEGVEAYAVDPVDHEARRYVARHVVLALHAEDLRRVAVTPGWPDAVQDVLMTAGQPDAVRAHVVVDAQAARFWRPDGVSRLPLATDGPIALVRGGAGDGRGYELLEVTWRGPEAEAFLAGGSGDASGRLVAALATLWPEFAPHVRHVALAPAASALSWPVGHSRLEGRQGELAQPVHQVLHLALEGQAGPDPDDAVFTAGQVVARVAKALGRAWTPPAPPKAGGAAKAGG